MSGAFATGEVDNCVSGVAVHDMAARHVHARGRHRGEVTLELLMHFGPEALSRLAVDRRQKRIGRVYDMELRVILLRHARGKRKRAARPF
jgi:hypothetical protein